MSNRCVGFGVNALTLSHTDHWRFNIAHHDKEFSEDLKKTIVTLHKDGLGQGCQTPVLKGQHPACF